MDAREILLRHISEGKSDRMKAFMKIVNYDSELAAMQEYAELYHKSKQVDEKQCMSCEKTVKYSSDIFNCSERVDMKISIKFECLLCGRNKFIRKTAHYCVGGYRKHGIKWKEIIFAQETK